VHTSVAQYKHKNVEFLLKVRGLLEVLYGENLLFQKCTNGRTPLHIAVVKIKPNRPEILNEILSSCGVDLEKISTTEDLSGDTFIHAAVKQAVWLKQYTALRAMWQSTNLEDRNKTILLAQIKKCLWTELEGCKSSTMTEVLEKLDEVILQDLTTPEPDIFEVEVLHLLRNRKIHDSSMLEEYIKKGREGEEPRRICDCSTETGENFLMLAAAGARIPVIKHFLLTFYHEEYLDDLRTMFTSTDKMGRTVLHHASNFACKKTKKELIDCARNLEVNIGKLLLQQDEVWNWTVLHEAVENRRCSDWDFWRGIATECNMLVELEAVVDRFQRTASSLAYQRQLLVTL